MFKRKIRRSREFNKNNKVIDFEEAREARKKKREEVARERQASKREKREEPSRRTISQKNRARNFFAALMIIVVAVIGFSVFNIISVNQQLAEAIAEKDRLTDEKESLESELENVDNQEYVEQQARILLKMIKPGEIYYVVPEETE